MTRVNATEDLMAATSRHLNINAGSVFNRSAELMEVREFPNMQGSRRLGEMTVQMYNGIPLSMSLNTDVEP